MNQATDPETPGETGDPETPGGKIKPPTGSQPASSQSQVGDTLQPEGATKAPETPIDVPPGAAGDPETPGSASSSASQDPIIVTGGG